MLIYEYGAGGSTIFFAKRAREVISVEHDPEWARRVTEVMQKGGYKNCWIQVIEPTLNATFTNGDPSDVNSYTSDDHNFHGRSFKDYASSIDRYPDEHFDIVLIDGRARPSCFKHAIPKVKKHGYVVWDNTDRTYYFPAMQTAPKTFGFMDFPGPSPYVDLFTRTSVWCNESA
jgi:predicted O-methyltransferase YrrM